MHPSSFAFAPLSIAAILAVALVPLACAQGSGSRLMAATTVGGTGGTGGASSSSASGQGGQGGAPSVDPSSACDGTGDCAGCQTCAQTTAVCADLYNQCMNSFRCTDVVDCWGSCGGDASCQQFCLQNDPQGAGLFETLATCARCACVADCGIDPSPCP